MSFRCGFCGKAVPNGIKQDKIVTEQRPIEYKGGAYDEEGKWHDIVSQGWEIVKETPACPDCSKKIKTAELVSK
jgi:allantoicase